jgi:MFS family permease
MHQLLKRLSFVQPEKSPVFYGYILVFFGTLGVLTSIPGQTHGISVFTDPVKDALGLSRNQFSIAYTLGTIASSLLLARAGRWYDLFGARLVAFFAAIGLSLSLVLCALSININHLIQNIIHLNSWLVPFLLMIVFFFFLRFTGQGMLTLASRNMMMKWFDKKRGRMNAISSIFVSVGFALSPLILSIPLDKYGWQKAWFFIALIVFINSIVIILFFRDNPEDFGLRQDGYPSVVSKGSKSESHSKKQFALSDAKKTRAFWMYSFMLAFNGFFATGITFHIVSLFNSAGYDRDMALSIFLPISMVSLVVSLIGNTMSDWIKMKYLLFTQILGGIVAAIGLIFLGYGFGIYLLIGGSGILGGLFAVFISVVWPKFYGREFLGRISGQAMSMVIFASAIAPTAFSLTFYFFNSYTVVGYISLAFLAFVAFLSIKADNPQ